MAPRDFGGWRELLRANAGDFTLDLARALSRATATLRGTRRLTEAERLFVDRNAAFWHHLPPPAALSRSYVVIEFQNHPLLALANASFAAIVAHARGLRLLFVLPSPQHSLKAVLSSYPGARFVYTRHWQHLRHRIAADVRALQATYKLRTPRELLAFSSDGIRFGDVIYDALLTRGYATIARLDPAVYERMRDFFCCRSLAMAHAGPDRANAYVGHFSGLETATFARYLLHAGTEVFFRVGAHQLIVKKWQGPEDLNNYALKPEPEYFKHMTRTVAAEVERLANAYLTRRFQSGSGQLATDAAFAAGKRVFDGKAEFCHQYGLPSDRRTAFVLLHEFTDYPHSVFLKPLMFQDYYEWFRRTLDAAVSTSHVNWIFKEHPSAHLYPTKDLNLREVFGRLNASNVRFLPADEDFNARSIPHLADAVVTCIGTAGLEYSCFGIPCVVGGEGPYTGFGFTIEPNDIPEYEHVLCNIGHLQRLRADQILAAKAVLLFELSMMDEAENAFCPRYTDHEVRALSAERLWQDAAENMAPNNWPRLREQVEALREFVNNPHYRQYVDVAKFPCMKAVVPGATQIPGTSTECVA